MKIVLSHNDPDGLISVALVLRKFPDLEIEFTVPSQLLSKLASYVNKVNNREFLVITDLAGNQDALYLSAIWKKVLWLDHHEWPSIEEIPKRVEMYTRIAPSAAEVVAEYLNIDDKDLIRVANELDTNQVSSKEAIDLRFLLAEWRRNFDLDVYHLKLAKLARELAEKGLEVLGNYSTEIERFEKEYKKQLTNYLSKLENIEIKEIEGRKVLFVPINGVPFIAGDAVSQKYQDIDIIVYYRKKKHGYKYEIRTQTDFPVLYICRALGGGGHRYACGATSELSPDQLIPLIERIIKLVDNLKNSSSPNGK